MDLSSSRWIAAVLVSTCLASLCLAGAGLAGPVAVRGDAAPLPSPYGALSLPGAGPGTAAKLPPAKVRPSEHAALPAHLVSKLAYRLIARQEAGRAGVPFDLVDAVMKIESDFDPTRRGDVGEIGLMQVRPGTAAMLGFRGGEDVLAAPSVNIHYGTTYLGKAWHLANGNVCRALMKYRAGHGNESMSALSVTYCSRAKAYLAAIQSPLATAITEADLVTSEPAPAVTTARPSRSKTPHARSSSRFWAAFEARIKKINARIEARWRRTASR